MTPIPTPHLPPKKVAFELWFGKISVGHLTLKDGVWEFRYSPEFLKQSDIRTLIDFPDSSRTYRSKHLWPFFAHRLPSVAQPQVRQAIEEEGLDENDQAQLLARFGRRAISNPFTLNPEQPTHDTMQPHVTTEPLDGTAVRAFFAIAERWGLSAEEQSALLGVGLDVLDAWRQSAHERIGRSQLDRISYIFGIYAALQTLIPSAAFRDRWIRQPNANAIFGGRAPLDRMFGGIASLALVREYLDGECGG